SGIDLAKGQVATITASGTWVTNPMMKGPNVGAGGHVYNKAGKTYVKPGAGEGCLLVRTGDTVLAFTRNNDAVRITTPGKIYFCTNDEPTEAGFARAREYTNGMPIPAAKDTIGVGFGDNSGALKVKVEVKRANS